MQVFYKKITAILISYALLMSDAGSSYAFTSSLVIPIVSIMWFRHTPPIVEFVLVSKMQWEL